MPEYNAGDAKLRIVPDAANFQKELQAKLDAMRVDFTVRLNIEMAQAKADMDRFRNEQDGRNINQRVNPQFSRANEALAAWRAEQRANAVDVPVKVDRDSGARAGAAARQGFLQEFAKLSSEVGGALGSVVDIGKVMGITSLVASIPGAITAVAALGQALAQLSGAALVVPGAIGGMVASFGTLALGMDGVIDAFTAVDAASNESAQTQAANANRIQSAQQTLTYAVQDEVHAQKDVTQARKDATRSLEDLNLQLRGGHISEEQAVNDAAKARRDLAKGGFKDALDLRDAQIRVESADQRVAESRQQNIELLDKTTTANAKGIEGSDQVVAANQALERSVNSVANAQQALATAMTYGDEPANKAAEAMKKLSPAAADFVKALEGLKPAWTDLKKTVSGNLFEGMASSFTTFVNGVLPNLKSGMGAIASAWNVDLKQLMASLGSDGSKGLLDRILGNTAQAQTNFAKAIDPLVKGLATLTAAGSDALPRLATAIGSIATRFSDFITAADADGRLAGWIDKGLTGFAQLGDILLNIGKAFYSITDALGDAIGGGGILGSLKDLTDRMATFLGSDAGQAKLRNFFKEGKNELDKWKPIVAGLIKDLPAIWNGAVEAANVFMPILTTIGDLLRGHPKLIGDIVIAFAAWKIIDGVVSLSTSLKGITSILSNDIPTAAEGGATKATKSLGKLDSILKKLGLLAAAAGIMQLGTDLLDQDPDTNAPTTGPGSLAAVAADIGGGALAGAQMGGPAGAAIGTVIGGVKATYDVLSGQSDAEKAQADALAKQQADAAAANPPKPYLAPADPNAPAGTPLPGIPLPGAGTPGATAPDPKLNPFLVVPGHEAGGPTNAGLAILHDDEFVLSRRASKYPDAFKHALNEGRIDPKALPHFENGGSHLQPGSPGPGPGNAGTPGMDTIPVGPAGGGESIQIPSAGGGATAPSFNIGTFIGGVLGIPALGSLGGGALGPDGQPQSIIGKADDGRTTIGGHAIGLDPKLLSGDPTAVAGATDYLKTWGMNTLQSAAQIAIGGNSLNPNGGILGGLGLQNSILSPNNSWNQDAQTALGFLGGGGVGGSTDSGMQTLTLPTGETIQVPYSGTSVTANGAGGVFTQAPGGEFIGQNAGAAAQLTAAFGDKGGSLDMTPGLLASKGIKPIYNWGPGSTAAGNVPGWVKTLAGQFGLTASTYDNGETLHVGGFAWDFNGPKDKMDAFATFVQSNLAGQTLQLIHADGDKRWGIAGGQAVGPGTTAPNYYANDWGGHFDHVHWATNGPVNISATDQSGAGSGTPYAPKAGAGATAGIGSGGALRTQAYAAYLAAGMPPGEWSDFDQLITHESGWRPTAQNPGSTAYGLGQFLDTTWATVGASKTSDPMTQLQGIFKYLKQRTDYHGSPATAWSLWQSRSPHWYDQGGVLPPGLTMAMNHTGENERILNPAQNKQYEAMLPHFLDGGPFKVGTVTPKPLPKIPDARPMIPKLPPIPLPGNLRPIYEPGPPAQEQPPAPDPAPTPGDDTPAPQRSTQPPENQSGPAGPPPDASSGSQSHLLPAVETGIKSGATAIGNAVSTAASIGSMGMGGGGGMGGMISGLFNLGGKAVTDAANVAASFLVGSVSDIGGKTGNAYGSTYRSSQAQPATASNHNTTNYNGGIVVQDPQEMRREMDLRDAQHMQSIVANH